MVGMRAIRPDVPPESPAAALMFCRGIAADGKRPLYSEPAMGDLPATFRLAGHRVDPSLNRITAPSGETAQVEPKIMNVLIVLVEHAGEVVSRDELMAR